MDAPPPSLASSLPRAVPAASALAWFEAAMRMFKRAPMLWCVLGFITLAGKIALELIPGIGRAASEVIVPVIECGLLIGAAELDRGRPLAIGHAFAAFRAPPRALAAIVVSALLVSAAETVTAYALAGVNLLADPTDVRLTTGVLVAVISAATFASLPLVFVPFAALFEQARFVEAFAASLRGFALNIAPLLLFGLLSLVLTLVGLLLFWIGLVAVLPLLAAASYAAWKDIYRPRALPTPY
ncbi:MAG TPA: hypothetical protein VGA51_10655 [Casimicrobiaceae bacterium]